MHVLKVLRDRDGLYCWCPTHLFFAVFGSPAPVAPHSFWFKKVEGAAACAMYAGLADRFRYHGDKVHMASTVGLLAFLCRQTFGTNVQTDTMVGVCRVLEELFAICVVSRRLGTFEVPYGDVMISVSFGDVNLRALMCVHPIFPKLVYFLDDASLNVRRWAKCSASAVPLPLLMVLILRLVSLCLIEGDCDDVQLLFSAVFRAVALSIDHGLDNAASCGLNVLSTLPEGAGVYEYWHAGKLRHSRPDTQLYSRESRRARDAQGVVVALPAFDHVP